MRIVIPFAAALFAAALGWTAHAFLYHGAIEQCVALGVREDNLLARAIGEIGDRNEQIEVMSHRCPRGERL